MNPRRRRTSPIRTVRRLVTWAVVLATFALLGLLLLATARRHPEDLPWTRLDLAQPVGLFTGRKLAALTGDGAGCRTILDRAGVRFTALPDIRRGRCGYTDGVRLRQGGALDMRWSPSPVAASCPVAAGLSLWIWHVVQPAAFRHLGAEVVRVEHFGSYNCRRMYGRGAGDWSEHATADALDIAGFRLADGRRISVLGDWKGRRDRAAFLHEVRDGACDLFSTVLSPDYNRAHADHLHFDQAERGATGWRACR